MAWTGVVSSSATTWLAFPGPKSSNCYYDGGDQRMAASSPQLYLSIRRWSLDDLSSELLALIFEQVGLPKSPPLPIRLLSELAHMHKPLEWSMSADADADVRFSSGISTSDR